MSQFYYGGSSQGAMKMHTAVGSNAHHHNANNNHRSRRSTRFSSTQAGGQKYFKEASRIHQQKESAEAAQAAASRRDFEAARSFDLEDDEIFCPWHLLTDDDLQSIHSSNSDRSSSSGSESPDHSPLQHQLQPTTNFTMPSTHQQVMGGSAFSNSSASHQFKIHAPQAQRARNPIPIVDPNARQTSPPTSISPNGQVPKSWYPRRW